MIGKVKLVDSVEQIESELMQSLNSLNQLETKESQIAKKNIMKAISQYQKLGKKIIRIEQQLEKAKIENANLIKERDAIVSDNYLLEFKKKDLLMLANELEEANEDIEKKGAEILEQAKALQEKKDELQDQADYLHDANETITSMHSELQTQRDEIWQKNQDLENLNNEKNNLIGIVAHDLKSPLNQIGGLITLLKMTADLDTESMEYVDTMSDSVNRLNSMIAKILDIEAIEAQTLNLNLEKVDLSEVIGKIVGNYRFTAKEKNILLVETLPDGNANVNVDASYANQIYENLISNAIKFSPSDKNIFISLYEVENTWRCDIKDEGPGISDDDKKKLFGKFQKLSAKPTGNEISTGLGLSIVKKYVDAMNGKIWCESEFGQGASFIVQFAKA